MKSIASLCFLIGIIFLSGCMGYTAEERNAIWKQRCADYGHEVGSKEMATCIGEEYRAYRQRLTTIMSD